MNINVDHGSNAPDVLTSWDDEGQVYIDGLTDPSDFGFFGISADLALVVRRIDQVAIGLDGRMPRGKFAGCESPTQDAPSGKSILTTEDWPQPGEWKRVAELSASLSRDSTILFLGAGAHNEWVRISKNLYVDVSRSSFALALKRHSVEYSR